MKRFVPYSERHGNVTIYGGDGSKWLADLQAENDNMQYQQRGGTPSKPKNNDHTRWPHEAEHPGLSWTWCFLIGLGIAGAILYAIMQGELPV